MPTLYQRRTLVPAADVGQPGALPAALRGLSDASLADLPSALNAYAVTLLGLDNTGFVPVVVADVPGRVNRLQFITALQGLGFYAAVRTAVNGLAATDPISIYFLNTPSFGREDPRLLDFATLISASAATVDAVFVAAGQVPS